MGRGGRRNPRGHSGAARTGQRCLVNLGVVSKGRPPRRAAPQRRESYRAEEYRVPSSLSGWKQKVVAFASGLGAPGLFLISFLDSSVLTFPIINDLLLIELSIEHPARMPLYAFMAALGSVLGCVALYFIARKGGEAFFHRKAGEHAHAIRHWVERNGFVGMLIAALLPPPTPFKFFVFAHWGI